MVQRCPPGKSSYGRYAHDIIEVLEMFGDLSGCDHESVIETARKTQEMIRMSIDAFTRKDVELAKKIPAMDDLVDESYTRHLRAVMEGRGDVKCSLSATLILQYLERISDHATYIGDSIVYIVTGVEPTPWRTTTFVVFTLGSTETRSPVETLTPPLSAPTP